jgi:hypothetical protein
MAQNGTVVNKSSWFLLYRESVIQNSKVVRKQWKKRLAPISDRYKTEADLKPLIRKILREAEDTREAPNSEADFVTYVARSGICTSSHTSAGRPCGISGASRSWTSSRRPPSSAS